MLKADSELSGNSRLFKTYVRTEKRPDGAEYTIVDYYVMKDGKLVRLESDLSDK